VNPDSDLYARQAGPDGDVVVFLHPASGSADSWIHQIDEFAAAGFRVVAYDRRGTGRSPRAQATDVSAVTDLDQLRKHLGVETVHLVAAAGGGPIALEFTLLHPDRVDSLVLSGTVGGLSDPGYLAMQDRCLRPEIVALPWPLAELSAGYRALHPEGVRRWEAVRQAAHQDRQFTPGKLSRELITVARLKSLTTPTLLLAGGADLLTPPALLRELAKPLARHEFRILNEAGHAAFWEAAPEWNATVLDFLKRHRVRPHRTAPSPPHRSDRT
jgi:pimeloyl-ACP methyl ester carboxylesterase